MDATSFLFVNAVKIYQLKATDSEMKPYPLCSGNISKHFAINNVKKTGLESSLRIFSVYAKNISDIHRFLMKQK